MDFELLKLYRRASELKPGPTRDMLIAALQEEAQAQLEQEARKFRSLETDETAPRGVLEMMVGCAWRAQALSEIVAGAHPPRRSFRDRLTAFFRGAK